MRAELRARRETFNRRPLSSDYPSLLRRQHPKRTASSLRSPIVKSSQPSLVPHQDGPQEPPPPRPAHPLLVRVLVRVLDRLQPGLPSNSKRQLLHLHLGDRSRRHPHGRDHHDVGERPCANDHADQDLLVVVPAGEDHVVEIKGKEEPRARAQVKVSRAEEWATPGDVERVGDQVWTDGGQAVKHH